MIVDIVKSNGVPLEHQCKEIECKYYKPAEKKCPECGSNDLSKILTIVYKIMREIRR